MRQTFHKIIRDADLFEGCAHGTVVNGWPVGVARGSTGCYAFIDKCTHLSARLTSGRVVRDMIQCALHGARFKMTSGYCSGSSYKPILTFQHRIQDGWIEVAVPDERPGPEHQPASG